MDKREQFKEIVKDVGDQLNDFYKESKSWDHDRLWSNAELITFYMRVLDFYDCQLELYNNLDDNFVEELIEIGKIDIGSLFEYRLEQGFDYENIYIDDDMFELISDYKHDVGCSDEY